MTGSLTPWRHRRRLRLGHKLFGDSTPDLFDDEDSWFSKFFDEALEPRANVSESDEDYGISLELPGMKEEDVDVRVIGDRLVVSGERKHESEKKAKHYHRREFQYGAFERSFELPSGVRKDPESVSATFSKGLLEIRVPKVEPQPTAKIPIKSADSPAG